MKTKRSRVKTPSVWRLSYSYVGVLMAVLFFALSLTPSLLPRGIMFQGLVSGIAAAIGYGLGLGLQSTWLYLQLPAPPKSKQALINKILTTMSLLVLFIFLWKFVGWQNEVRDAVGVSERVSPTGLIPVFVIAAITGQLILVVSRSIVKLFNFTIRWFRKVLPRRTANVLGAVAAFSILTLMVNGVIINGFFALANQAFSVTDSTTNEGNVQPVTPEKSGSPQSLAEWDTLGRQGRVFVSTGPTKDQLNEFSGGGAIEPVRVYAGLKSADGTQAQADLALEELIRTGGFDREVLVIVTTTGTGWLDPKAVDPLEYIYNGDTAIVGVQYSFLPSWISLFADQAKSKDTSRIVFSTIHSYWSELPENERPEIYVYGLSLGSFGAESILQSVNIVNEPISGAILSGPTLFNDLRNNLTENRDEGSPNWKPVVDEGRTVRFTGKENALDEPTADWGDTKIVYTQYATDPVSFFSFDLALNEPEWLSGERGPDIIDTMSWIPFVTMWQVAVDLPSAGSVPDGHGHNYSRSNMTDAWVAVTEPDNWTDEDSSNLKSYFNE